MQGLGGGPEWMGFALTAAAPLKASPKTNSPIPTNRITQTSMLSGRRRILMRAAWDGKRRRADRRSQTAANDAVS